MRSLRPFPAFIPRLCSNFLPFFAGLALLLVAAGLDVTISTHALLQNWQERLTPHNLAILPPATSLDRPRSSEDEKARQALLFQILQRDRSSHDPNIMSEAEIKGLSAQWGSAWTGQLPFVIRFSYKGDPRALEHFIRQKLPEAIVIVPPDLTRSLPVLVQPLRLAGFGTTLFLLLAGESLFLLAFLLSLAHGWQKNDARLKLLFYAGCPLSLFRRKLLQQVGWRCLAGGYGGLFIMVPLLNLGTTLLRPLLHLPTQSESLFHNPFSHDSFGLFWGFILILWPVLNCLIGCAIALICLRRASGRFYV